MVHHLVICALHHDLGNVAFQNKLNKPQSKIEVRFVGGRGLHMDKDEVDDSSWTISSLCRDPWDYFLLATLMTLPSFMCIVICLLGPGQEAYCLNKHFDSTK